MSETTDQILLAAIDERCRALLRRLADGDDLPPAQQFRLEGLLEAAALCGALDADAWLLQLDALHREIVGCAIAERAGDDWQHLHPFPELPLYMARAPVSPSTSD